MPYSKMPRMHSARNGETRANSGISAPASSWQRPRRCFRTVVLISQKRLRLELHDRLRRELALGAEEAGDERVGVDDVHAEVARRALDHGGGRGVVRGCHT